MARCKGSPFSWRVLDCTQVMYFTHTSIQLTSRDFVDNTLDGIVKNMWYRKILKVVLCFFQLIESEDLNGDNRVDKNARTYRYVLQICEFSVDVEFMKLRKMETASSILSIRRVHSCMRLSCAKIFFIRKHEIIYKIIRYNPTLLHIK